MTMKPKQNYKPGTADKCMTPNYALDPLLPYLRRFQGATVWEPAVGSGNIDGVLRRQGFGVVSSDISTGVDFLTVEPPAHDLHVTNPPYSLKFAWLRRCYDLGRPFALLLPVEAIGAKSAQILFKRHGMEILLLDQRVNFIMPRAGLSGGGAQFPVLWLCWQVLPRPVCYGSFSRRQEVAA
jgi:hypothetical protein